MRYRLIAAERAKEGFCTLTVEHTPNWFENFFGKKIKRVEYYGQGSEWNELPSFKRCPKDLEPVLNVFYAKIQ